MTDAEPVVFLICDNSKTRRQFATRLKLLGYEAQLYNSADEFQKRSFGTDAGCVLVFLTDPDGELQWLKEAGPCDGHWPVIALAADADVETAVRAMKNGAFDFLLESCGDRRLSAAIDEAFARDAVCRRQTATVQSIRRRMEQLPPSLRQVLDLLLKGKSNREIADELDLSERAIEDRRAKLMQAMKARSLVSLVRQALLAEGVMVKRGCGEMQAR
jgi:FixJ family two-component response regulator